jgi:hypothetical protein
MTAFHYLIEGRDKTYRRLRDAKQAAKELSRKGDRIEVVRSDGRPIYSAKFTRLTWDGGTQ